MQRIGDSIKTLLILYRMVGSGSQQQAHKTGITRIYLSHESRLPLSVLVIQTRSTRNQEAHDIMAGCPGFAMKSKQRMIAIGIAQICGAPFPEKTNRGQIARIYSKMQGRQSFTIFSIQ